MNWPPLPLEEWKMPARRCIVDADCREGAAGRSVNCHWSRVPTFFSLVRRSSMPESVSFSLKRRRLFMDYKLAVVILFLCVNSTIGQTPSELEKKYGKPVISYVVSENILMTPEYTTDGQVCAMRLHPRHFSGNTNHVSPSLPFEELTRVLNQLVPPPTRGAKKEPFDTGAAGEEANGYFTHTKTHNFISSLLSTLSRTPGRPERSTYFQSNPQLCLRRPSPEIRPPQIMISLQVEFQLLK